MSQTGADGFSTSGSKRAKPLKARPRGQQSPAQYIIHHPSIPTCRINRRKEGGFVTPHGVLPGLHSRIKACLPDNTSVVWRGKCHTRVPPHMMGLKVHAELAALANKNKPVKTKRAQALVRFLAAKGWSLVRAEVNVFAQGFCATALDLICHDTATGQAVILELKTTPKTGEQHTTTYNIACRQAPKTLSGLRNSEYTRHQLQLAGALHMVTSTLKVATTKLQGAVLVVTCDCRVYEYPLTPVLRNDIGAVVRMLTPR